MNAETVNADTRRTLPTIWVKQIALFKSLKQFDEIRSVHFSPGMNIIQGEWNDSSETFESGHGNGKTTLCRLIRYCLGEKSFGQQHVVEEVKHCFPTGYVGAVIEVGGEEWSVLRSLGNRGKDFAKQGVTLSELVGAEEVLSYSRFTARIEEVALATLQRRDVLSGGHSIQWLHLLALGSRDQESRYDRFWNLRHMRSDSGTPKLTKGDVSLGVRSILGILDPKEPRLRNRLAELEAQLEQLRGDIKEKQAEPTYHITRLRTALTQEMGVVDADITELEGGQLFDVKKASDVRIKDLQSELLEISQKIAPLDRQINMATSQYNELLELQEQQEAAGEATEDCNSVLLNELARLRSMKQGLFDRSFRECVPGRILFGDCEKVKAHIADIDGMIEVEQKRTFPEVVSREQAAAHLADQAKRQDDPLHRLREKLDELNGGKNGLLERRRTVNDLLERIPLATAEILKWHRIISGDVANDYLSKLESVETEKSEDLAKLKSQLTELLAKQNDRAKQFGSRFNEIVQQTINSTFKGTILVEDDGISFRINRDKSLGGEAYETLAVLLADIAILVESSMNSVCHPGLLIHDSPREADLNIRLYEKMLDVAFSFMASKDGNVPYQYIVTTTTRPSTTLQAPSITKVILSSGGGSLFKRQLDVEAQGPNQRTLFDTTEQT